MRRKGESGQLHQDHGIALPTRSVGLKPPAALRAVFYFILKICDNLKMEWLKQKETVVPAILVAVFAVYIFYPGGSFDHETAAYDIENAQYFGNQAKGDLNGDGEDDIAFLITQNNGGSGTFFYVVAALKDGNDYRITNSVLLGDRISPQTTEIQDGMVIVNYADRMPNETMTDQPSLGVSQYLRVVDGTLIKSR
jgi:hypothetical protein